MYNWSYPELKVYKTENYFKKKLEKKLFLFFSETAVHVHKNGNQYSACICIEVNVLLFTPKVIHM